ncbi:MAG: DUF2089 family protein [Acidobacteria bacterium]|nr:DUF2089 family protein [Acidobacteriota bacterium]
MKEGRAAEPGDRKSWFEYLSDEDLAFIKRFIMASGSLKELAQSYGITYPTIRLRLDRLIEKIRVLDEMETVSEFELVTRALYADGRLDMATMKALLEAHRQELASRSEKPKS